MGRPYKLTPAIQERIVQAITAGNDNVVAAAYAGIADTTYYRWMAEGLEAKTGQLKEFRDSVLKAQADAEVRNVAIVEQAATRTWQAAAWWLERKHNARWGRKERQEISGPDGSPLQVSLMELAKEIAEG